MSIQEHLNKIRNAIYGREVRESIAKGIETAYDDASEKDNANMEVKIARGTHPNLRSRLEEVDNKLAQTIRLDDSNLTLNNFTEEDRAVIQGLEPGEINAVLGEGNVRTENIGESQVTPEKTSFFTNEGNDNLFDYRTAERGVGMDSQTGAIVPVPNNSLSDFIPVKAGLTYSGDYGIHVVGFFDSEKNIISAVNIGSKGLTNFTTVEGTGYVRVSFRHDVIPATDFRIISGGLFPPPKKEDYYSKTIDAELIGKIPEEKLGFLEPGKNLFNKELFVRGYSVSSIDGKRVRYEGYGYSDFIEVIPSAIYTISHGRTVVFYDKDKQFVRGDGAENQGERTLIAPSNTRYMVVSVKESERDLLQVELGKSKTEYEEYRLTLPVRLFKNAYKTTNLFDLKKVTWGYSLNSPDGREIPFLKVAHSDFIKVKGGTEYSITPSRHTVIFYDSNKEFISGTASADGRRTFTTPENADFVRFSFRIQDTDFRILQMNEGMPKQFEPYYSQGGSGKRNVSFRAEFETAKLEVGPNINGQSTLALIATKRNNHTSGNNSDNKMPIDEGYLYLDESTNKLYYSSGVYNRPRFLFDWDSDLSGGRACSDYHAMFTQDGDVIFFLSPYTNTRANPIFYPNSNYENPKEIEFGEKTKPLSFLWDNGHDNHAGENFFMFAEYRAWNLDEVGTPVNIWKVTKPFDNPDNWRVVHTMYHTHYSQPTAGNPGKETAHFHTLNRDYVSGAWIATTGDTLEQNKILMSVDDGETWVDQGLEGGQWIRLVGFVFLEDTIYYQTDSTFRNHTLYEVPRDENGYPDFQNITKVIDLSATGEAGYGTAYTREPEGLLFIDRTEPRHDSVCDLFFYSLEYKDLYRLGTYERVNGDQEGRHGLPPLAYTTYQSPYEDGIIMGSTTKTKPFTLNILNNTEGNLLGNLKMKIVESQD